MLKFTCQKDLLVHETAAVQKIISIKNNTTILSNVLLEAKDDFLIIQACDVRLRFETRIPVKIETEGKITIFADKLFNIIKTLPGTEIEFAVNNDKLNITPMDKNGLNIQLRWQSSENFPIATEPDGNTYFRLMQKNFIHMITQTFFAVSKDETRIFMNGVFLRHANDKLVMVATDGRRLSLIEIPDETMIVDFEGVIIHPKFLTVMQSLACGEGELALSLTENTVYAQFDNSKLSATLIEGQFPKYERVIPASQTYDLTMDRQLFLDSLRRVAVFADDKTHRIILKFSTGKVEMIAEDAQVGGIHEEIECDFTDGTLTMAMNHNYLREPLSVMTCEKFRFQLTDANHAITLRPDGDDSSLHVVMPMQLD